MFLDYISLDCTWVHITAGAAMNSWIASLRWNCDLVINAAEAISRGPVASWPPGQPVILTLLTRDGQQDDLIGIQRTFYVKTAGFGGRPLALLVGHGGSFSHKRLGIGFRNKGTRYGWRVVAVFPGISQRGLASG